MALSKARRKSIRSVLIIAAVFVAVVALLWLFTPLKELAKPTQVAAQLEAIEKVAWSPLVFVAAYVLGGLVMFPVTVLSAATAIVFVPYKAIVVSFTGIMLSAALLHWIGARLRGSVKKALGRTIKKVDEALQDRGILTIAAIRMVPLAPFTLVNIAAGCLGVPSATTCWEPRSVCSPAFQSCVCSEDRCASSGATRARRPW